MSTTLESAFRQKLQDHLNSMVALRDRNFDRTRNLPLVTFGVRDYMDPIKKTCPTRYRIQIRGVAITDMRTKGKSLQRDYRNDLQAMVRELAPRPLDWEPVVTDALASPDAQPLTLHLYLPNDPIKPMSPDVYFETKVWHPNIRWEDGHTCYGSKHDWADPSRTMADLVRRIHTMVAYLGRGAVNVQAADLLNAPAGQWYNEMHALMPDLFPFSSRYLV